jgi:hypothetical protein
VWCDALQVLSEATRAATPPSAKRQLADKDKNKGLRGWTFFSTGAIGYWGFGFRAAQSQSPENPEARRRRGRLQDISLSLPLQMPPGSWPSACPPSAWRLACVTSQLAQRRTARQAPLGAGFWIADAPYERGQGQGSTGSTPATQWHVALAEPLRAVVAGWGPVFRPGRGWSISISAIYPPPPPGPGPFPQKGPEGSTPTPSPALRAPPAGLYTKPGNSGGCVL